ncbi:hypothetical protein GCM10022219_16590 [Microbacterium oryzae]|uniref:Small multidrug efflux protein n=1 Tax=Microbacterium oryzae TaxID=743009 RepID=A0A6I6E5I3_9MICO|nr:small multidrug efflux protein [Microbacterium oryzae]QGU28037.1 small multidrug efflux protein [Microbacterium oryzae]
MTLIHTFQDLVDQVPDLVQPLIVAAAGAVPFIEGEGAVAVGIMGGIHPATAAVAAMLGNFLCVAALVILSSGARRAIVTRRSARVAAREHAFAGAPTTVAAPPTETAAPSPRRVKFQRAFERYGVPGVSLLGPLLLPTHFTATMLAAAGIGKVRILAWQAVAIAGWTTVIALLIAGAVAAVG